MTRIPALLGALLVLLASACERREQRSEVDRGRPAASLPSRVEIDARAALGRRLFDGDEPLVGRIVGHDEALPPASSRCVNCHGRNTALPDKPRPIAFGEDEAAFAPALDRVHLLEPRSRRGAPPSRFDLGSFCRLLRTGIDPAFVVVPRAMPRYAIDDRQCAALWESMILADEPRRTER